MPRSRRHSYSEEQLKAAIQQATSVRQALLNLGITSVGGSYRVIRKAILEFNIDVSHFTGSTWSKGRTLGSKRPINVYLEGKYSITSHALRLRLVREGLKEARCESCGLREWMAKPIPLELDHMDGNPTNNLLTNLRILCPNCHAMTTNYRGKNKKPKS